MIKDPKWRSQVERKVIEGAQGFDIVASLTSEAAKSSILVYVMGFVVSTPVAVALVVYTFSWFDSYQTIWTLSFLLALLGTGMLILQIVYAHEVAHHTYFKTASWMPYMRISIAALSFTLAVFPLLVFFPGISTNQIGEIGRPFGLYNQLAVLSLTISVPYLSKVIWDYLPLKQSVSRKLPLASAILYGIFFLIVVFGLWFAGLIRLSITNVAIQMIAVMAMVGGATFSITWGMSGFRNGNSYSTSEYDIPTIDQFQRYIFRNRKYSFFSGFVSGIGLPSLAGSSRAISVGISPGNIDLFVLMFGYFNLILVLSTYIIMMFVLSLILIILLWITSLSLTILTQ